MLNSCKFAPKCSKWNLKLVRQYMLLPQNLAKSCVNVSKINSTKSISPKYPWVNKHGKLRNQPNSFKLALKCPKQTRTIVRLYVLLPHYPTKGSANMSQRNCLEVISLINLWANTHYKKKNLYNSYNWPPKCLILIFKGENVCTAFPTPNELFP